MRERYYQQLITIKNKNMNEEITTITDLTETANQIANFETMGIVSILIFVGYFIIKYFTKKEKELLIMLKEKDNYIKSLVQTTEECLQENTKATTELTILIKERLK